MVLSNGKAVIVKLGPCPVVELIVDAAPPGIAGYVTVGICTIPLEMDWIGIKRRIRGYEIYTSSWRLIWGISGEEIDFLVGTCNDVFAI